MGKSGLEGSGMSATSVLQILRTIKERGSVSRTDLQQLTELSWGTITNTTRELLQRNLIREEGAVSTKAGRKPVQLAVNRAGHALIGIEIARGVVRCLMMNLGGDALWYEEISISDGDAPAEVLKRTGNLIEHALQAHPGRSCMGVGVAVNGALDRARGTLRWAAHMPAWRDVPVRRLLQNQARTTVRLERQAHCLALAERWFGEARDAENVLCVSVGETVGLGILLDDEILRGSQGLAGDFGHMTVDPQGAPCSCGDRGCVEAYCAFGALVDYTHSVATPDGPASKVRTVEEVVSLAQAHDPAAREALERMGKMLGIGVANLLDLFNPDLVVLAGDVMRGADCFMTVLEAEVEGRAGGDKQRGLMISQLGPRAAAMGACGMILQASLDHGDQQEGEPSVSVPA